jgi:hypothetical protein
LSRLIERCEQKHCHPERSEGPAFAAGAAILLARRSGRIPTDRQFRAQYRGPSLAFVELRGTKDRAQDDSLWELHVEGVDFLGADVSHKERRAIGSEAAPQSDRAEIPTEIFQIDDYFGLGPP